MVNDSGFQMDYFFRTGILFECSVPYVANEISHDERDRLSSFVLSEGNPMTPSTGIMSMGKVTPGQAKSMLVVVPTKTGTVYTTARNLRGYTFAENQKSGGARPK